MSLLPKSAFVGLDGISHLCTGGEAPWLRSHNEACLRFGELKSDGMAGRDEMFRVAGRVKSGVATLLGVSADRVAFLSHASEGISQAVASVDWRSGDNAVFADLEYPSLIYPIVALREQGVEARVVKSTNHYLSMDDLAKAVDARTRLILVSHVSFLTGQRLDLARCAEIARSVGAWLAVDATHGFGVAPVDGELCDFVVSSCYKWILATHGVGIFAFNAARVGELRPATFGWHSVSQRGGPADPLSMPLREGAARVEAGNPSLLGLFVLDSALTARSAFSESDVLPWVEGLATVLLEGLRSRGHEVITPANPDERAGNICFLADDAIQLATRMTERGVQVWGGDGRIRVSAHLYNDPEDVDAFFKALDSVSAVPAR